MSRFKLFIPLIVFVLLALLFWSVLKKPGYNPQDLPSALINQPLPSFALATVESDAIVKASDITGDVFLLNVWATWCITCRVEHPYLVKLRNQGVKIIGINYKDDRVKALDWLREYSNPYAVNLFDVDGKLGLDLGVYGAPETYVVDIKGIIRYKYVGDINEAVWQEKIKPVYEQLKK
jgi:cytochrome c biogenesis protein CcmG/thiol:disulfide interchange protein DsbE